MNFGTPIALILLLASSSLVVSMENGPTSQSAHIFPCKNQKIAHVYDAFVTQLDLPLNPSTPITKPKYFTGKKRKSNNWSWQMYQPNAKKSESIDERCKKIECASALLAIKKCTCHKKTCDASLPS